MKPLKFEAYATGLTFSAEKRTITGIITTFNTPSSDYRRIVMTPGALRPRLPLSRVKLLRDHDSKDPVGYMLALDPLTAEAKFKVPEGENGDRALEEASPDKKLRDGLSVGIQALNEDGAYEYDSETDTYTVYAAELVEVSLCAIPAYPDAGVTNVQATRETLTLTPTPTQENNTVPTLTIEDLDKALDSQRVDLERVMDTRLAAHAAPPAPSGPQWDTFGSFLKDLSEGSTEAAEFHKTLAYSGAKTSDDYNRNAWVADAIHLIDQNRKVMNSFTVESLPAKGMVLEYVKLKTNSMTVEKQASEGADLSFGKIQLTSATAKVDTYGGYTELSRQIIDRANAEYLTTAGTAMDLEYARSTEAATRALLAAVITEQTTAGNKLDLAAGAGTDEWLDLIVDAIDTFETRGYTLKGTKVSKDVFKKLMRLEDTAGNRLMLVSGPGVNQVGEIDLSSLSGRLGPVRFEILPDAAANTVAFYDKLAITTWESPGAPWQLNAENVVNLTEQTSKFGYLAQASQHPDAILPVEIA